MQPTAGRFYQLRSRTVDRKIVRVLAAIAALLQFLSCRHDIGDGIAAEEGVHVRIVGSGTDDCVDVLSHKGL